MITFCVLLSFCVASFCIPVRSFNMALHTMTLPTAVKLLCLAAFVLLVHFQWQQTNGPRDAGSAGNHRSLLELPTPPANFVDIQRKWHNWNACTNSFKNDTFETRQYFNPASYFFLSYAPTCDVTEKKGTIGTGKLTFVLPLVNIRFADWTDDYKDGLCGLNTTEQVEQSRFEEANKRVQKFNDPENKKGLYSKVDGKDLGYFYIYDNGTFYLEECPGKEICPEDPCDFNRTTCKGIDAFPLFGWWSTDTRIWRNGDTHTFELGWLSRDETLPPVGCSRTKFIITASGVNKCYGIFGLDFGFNFCPLLWFLQLFQKS